jgi:cobalt/nickel transport system permease protein
MRRRHFFLAFAVAALLLAGVVSSFAAGSPDGLQRVAHDQGIATTEKDHALDDGPMAGYGVRTVDDPLVSGGLAGVAGVLVVLVVTRGLTLAVRRRNADGRGR